MKLVLFDVDGTLLSSGGAGARAMRRALEEVFGTWGDPAYRYDGKTDRQIVRELMRGEGHEDDFIDGRMSALFTRYLEFLEVEVASGEQPPSPLPGVPALLDDLERREDIVLGLLTGNVEAGATMKLRAAGIDPSRFRVNAYGSDHEHRPALPAFARRRALETLGHEIPFDAMVVVGDTPADIECGREAGAHTIAVATGRYGADELRGHSPTAVFDTLSDTAAVVGVITSA